MWITGVFRSLSAIDCIQHRKTPVIHILLNNQSLDFVSIEQQEAGYIPYGVD